MGKRAAKKNPAESILLGIEGGGTRCVVVAVNQRFKIIRRIELGPANLRLLTDAQLVRLFKEIRSQMPEPSAIGLGFAGLRSGADAKRVGEAVARVWPNTPFQAAHDLEIALRAVPETKEVAARILVLSGTGSCCYGKTKTGKTVKVGGWGHILGDKGSGYEIGLRALKACVFYFDRDESWSRLGERLLRALCLNEPDDLIAWVQNATKTEIAALAPEVFAAAQERDKIARDILEGVVATLSRDAVTVAKRLGVRGRCKFIFAGSVLRNQPEFAARIGREIRRLRRGSVCSMLTGETVLGAVKLAAEVLRSDSDEKGTPSSRPSPQGEGELLPARDHADRTVSLPVAARIQSPLLGERVRVRANLHPTESFRPKDRKSATESGSGGDVIRLATSPTEQRNPRSMKLDSMPLRSAIALMLTEESKVAPTIAEHAAEIERAIKLMVRAFKSGGRLFYVGAGTSGRLGVLDASECPPTFSVPRDLVQGIMAGGQTALWQSVEGAEDDPVAGARAVRFRKVTRRDVVVGIAASGRTPFVWGALKEAQRQKAKTVLVCFNPDVFIPPDTRPGIVIAVNVGPEVLTGSTRLKAGTATKLVLNLFTTLAMVQMGKVVQNLMVDLNASNVKLRDRAVRIVREISRVDAPSARAALERSRWNIKQAFKKVAAKN